MAFKMKNPSIAKMVKAAGDNRVAMKMKAESAMKMKEAAMKLERDAAMKKYVSDAQRKAVHASKAESAMKAAKPDYIDIDGDGNKTESMKQAAADKKSGMKMKKSPAKMGHSPKKMKKSAMKKVKTFELKSSDLTQSEEERKRDRGEGRNPKQDRRNFYNEKKTRRKVEKSRKADAKARTAMEAYEAKAPKTQAAQDAMSAKEAKKVGKLGKKAAKTAQKARVKEAVASRQLSKKGVDATKPKRTKKEKGPGAVLTGAEGKGVLRPGKKTRIDVGETIKNKIDDITSGERKARKARNKAARQDDKAKIKSYRQKTGLRGGVNVRRKAKGKEAI